MSTSRTAPIDHLTSARLVDLVLACQYADLPQEAVAATKVFLADTLTVGVAGTCAGSAQKAFDAARSWGQGGQVGGQVRVLGHPGAQLSPHAAAFVNGQHIHCLEWDALHEHSVVIALCVTTGALISELETRQISGDALITALGVAVETSVFFAAASTAAPRFFRPAVAGLMGAVLAVAKVRGYGRMQMLDTLGLAYAQAGGNMQAHWEGSAALALQVGFAARAALTAADLVMSGLTGPHDVVDGKFGYFTLIETADDVDKTLDNWGKPWKITEMAHKPFPAGRATQAVLTALMDMRAETDFSAADLDALETHVPSLIKLLVDRPFRPDMSPGYARLCLEAVASAYLQDGWVDPRRFSEGGFDDAAWQALSQRVSLTQDDNPDPNAMAPQTVTLRLKDGRRFVRQVPAPLGAPDRPLDRAAQLEKARTCFKVAGYDGDADALFAAIDALERASDARHILDFVT